MSPFNKPAFVLRNELHSSQIRGSLQHSSGRVPLKLGQVTPDRKIASGSVANAFIASIQSDINGHVDQGVILFMRLAPHEYLFEDTDVVLELQRREGSPIHSPIRDAKDMRPIVH